MTSLDTTAAQDKPDAYFDAAANAWVMKIMGRVRPVVVDAGPNGDCIEWTTNLTGDGYPRISIGPASNRIEHYVHRLVAEMISGESAEGKYVRHTCDNPPCVNGDHLIIGTQAENMQDAAAKGRIRSPWFPDGHPQKV